MSKVVIIHTPGILQSGGLNRRRIISAFTKGFDSLAGASDPVERFFKPQEHIGIKINTLGGRRISTLPEVSLGLAGLLSSVIPPSNITIWDRSNQELKNSGYTLNERRGNYKIMGTDTRGVGYSPELAVHRSIGSLFSGIQMDVSSSISLAILKDHGLAGVTAGMKNYFGAIHNPNKYHDDNCNPFIADLFDHEWIKKKHRLSILDCLLVQYHRGPAYHKQWAAEYEAFIFSQDPVAADYVGWTIIEKLRSEKGLPTLREEGREPLYIQTAERIGLGSADPRDIEIERKEA